MLPNHSKRSLFITTVYLNMTNLPEYKKETLKLLNEALGIAGDESALVLPAVLYQEGLVRHEQDLSKYSDDVVKHRAKNEDDESQRRAEAEYFQGVCRAVLEVTPKWMQYGRREDMFSDLCRVFKLLPDNKQAVPHYY
jgi:hypothetical protein